VQAGTNTPIFTNGQDHVALTSQGLTGWDGDSAGAPLLLALPSGALPTFCTQQALSSQLSNGYLCSYPDNSVAIWVRPSGAQTWRVLGTEAEPGGSWSLSSAGQSLLPGAQPQSARTQSPSAIVTPTPVVPLPSDSDLAVSINPVSPAASVLVTGSACNRSTVYTADNVEIDFAFTAAGGLSPTPDHAAYDINQIAPNSCSQIVTSINTVFPWQSIAVSDTRVDWQRAG
jgi:hypothetical protein